MDKIYCGSGKEKTFDTGGSIIRVTLDLDLLIKEYDNHGFLSGRGEKKININVGTRRTVGEYGDTHTVTLDTWHPGTYTPPVSKPLYDKPEIGEDDDIPF